MCVCVRECVCVWVHTHVYVNMHMWCRTDVHGPWNSLYHDVSELLLKQSKFRCRHFTIVAIALNSSSRL
uniref:Uncharacterized protein n=1 Tax=Anguilla anguilla TaxID=7936 RepID=A0A0E9RT72_ANGAN